MNCVKTDFREYQPLIGKSEIICWACGVAKTQHEGLTDSQSITNTTKISSFDNLVRRNLPSTAHNKALPVYTLVSGYGVATFMVPTSNAQCFGPRTFITGNGTQLYGVDRSIDVTTLSGHLFYETGSTLMGIETAAQMVNGATGYYCDAAFVSPVRFQALVQDLGPNLFYGRNTAGAPVPILHYYGSYSLLGKTIGIYQDSEVADNEAFVLHLMTWAKDSVFGHYCAHLDRNARVVFS